MNYLMLVKGKEKHLINETEYMQEEKLREMVEKYPELINLPEIEKGNLLLPIAKEFKASDLICVDSHGDIIILEFKLEKNQTMRDIVAQILDYASIIWKTSYEEFNNNVKGYIKEKYENDDLATVFFEKLGDKIDLAKFEGDGEKWKSDFMEKIASNLNSGAFKLVIYANRMPDDIKRVVDYLYSVHRMDLHCVEVDYFEKEGFKILVPKHFDMGKRQPPSQEVRGKWDYDTFIEDVKAKCDDATVEATEKLFKFTEENADELQYGTGSVTGSFSFRVNFGQRIVTLFNVYSNGSFSVGFGWLKEAKVDEKLLKEFMDKMNGLEGIHFKETRWESVKTNLLNQGNNLTKFKEHILWMKDELRKS